MLANPSKYAEETALPNLFPKADLETDGWGNTMIEAYTGHHTGHRVLRKRLKVDIAS